MTGQVFILLFNQDVQNSEQYFLKVMHVMLILRISKWIGKASANQADFNCKLMGLVSGKCDRIGTNIPAMNAENETKN